ncbi:hypothetical protein [Dysgonomonas sp. ZJ279]|uniref:hypothetical protein n=1 Tax=Dysgonomonas sp. ZJ279 TaxID=2709796 RepID=UPI0013ED5138|nr:hypothetical protein [Dysgonomonas sp. ZJ279]
MALEILDANNDNVLVQTWTSIENVYIVIDFKPNPNDPDDIDKDKDVIEFKDLETIGWFGVYAMDLLDAETQLIKLMGNNKADNIVLISHGNVAAGDDLVFFADNNFKTQVFGSDIDDVIKDKDKVFKNHPKRYMNVEHLRFIVSNVKSGGNFVLGSCNSANNKSFLSNLQRFTGSRVNMYGINWTSTMPTIPKRDKDRNIIQGVGVVTADNLLKYSIIMPPDEGETDNGGAKLFPMGWQENDFPTYITDIRIGNCGLIVTP